MAGWSRYRSRWPRYQSCDRRAAARADTAPARSAFATSIRAGYALSGTDIARACYALSTITLRAYALFSTDHVLVTRGPELEGAVRRAEEQLTHQTKLLQTLVEAYTSNKSHVFFLPLLPFLFPSLVLLPILPLPLAGIRGGAGGAARAHAPASAHPRGMDARHSLIAHSRSLYSLIGSSPSTWAACTSLTHSLVVTLESCVRHSPVA
eukprot:2262808-Rhodomonas_salina.3